MELPAEPKRERNGKEGLFEGVDSKIRWLLETCDADMPNLISLGSNRVGSGCASATGEFLDRTISGNAVGGSQHESSSAVQCSLWRDVSRESR